MTMTREQYNSTRAMLAESLAATENATIVSAGTLVPYDRPMNFRDVAKRCRQLGFDVSRNDGEYRLAPRIANKAKAERRAYYTDDLADLLGTAERESEKQRRRDKLNKTQRIAADWQTVES